MTTIDGNKCRCNRCGNVAEMSIDNAGDEEHDGGTVYTYPEGWEGIDTEVVLCPYCTGAVTVAALGKTISRLQRICFAIGGMSPLHGPDSDTILGAVREWVAGHVPSEINWLEPPPDIAKILGE